MIACRRLDRLPSCELPGGVRLAVAATRRTRLLGLMGLRDLDRRQALLLPRCRSVHTFGMRFSLDLVWLDASGRVLRQDACVPPGRLRACRAAGAVVEVSAGAGARVATALAALSDGSRPIVDAPRSGGAGQQQCRPLAGFPTGDLAQPVAGEGVPHLVGFRA